MASDDMRGSRRHPSSFQHHRTTSSRYNDAGQYHGEESYEEADVYGETNAYEEEDDSGEGAYSAAPDPQQQSYYSTFPEPQSPYRQQPPYSSQPYPPVVLNPQQQPYPPTATGPQQLSYHPATSHQQRPIYPAFNEVYGEGSYVAATGPQQSSYPSVPVSMPQSKEKELLSTIARLEKNLRDLQQERLGALDNFQPKNDADLKEGMMKLQSQVTSASKSLSGSSTMEKSRRNLEKQTLTDDKADGVNLKNLLESVIWKQLMTELFEHPFQPFGDNSTEIKEAWCMIFRKGKCVD
jgi:hypothetical protein